MKHRYSFFLTIVFILISSCKSRVERKFEEAAKELDHPDSVVIKAKEVRLKTDSLIRYLDELKQSIEETNSTDFK